MVRVLVCILLFAVCSFGQTSHVQSEAAGVFDGSSSTTVAVTWGGNTTNGNLIVGWVTYAAASDSVSTITDSSANSYSKIATITDVANTQSTTTFFAQNITGGTTPTVTVTFSSSLAYRAVIVHEVAGAAMSSQPDTSAQQYQSNPGTGTDGVTSGAATVSAGAYVFSATQDSALNSATHTQGTGFTLAENGSGIGSIASEYLIQGGGGSRAGTWTTNQDNGHLTMMVAIEAASAGGGGCRTKLMLLGAGC